eukprot:403369519
MNKQMADMSMSSSTSKKQQKYKTTNINKRANESVNLNNQHADPDGFDDSRSDAQSSYMTSTMSYMGQGFEKTGTLGGGLNQSNLSSAFKQPPVIQHPLDMSSSHMSSSMSQISYEDGFINAEYNAINEEERARRRKQEKEQKLKEFQDKTKKSAKEKLQKQQQTQKQSEIEAQMKDRERILKAKDYAEKQRKLMMKNWDKNKNKGNVTVLSQDDPAGQHTNYHAQIKHEQSNLQSQYQSKVLSEPIQEVSEHDESQSLHDQTQAQDQQQQLQQQQQDLKVLNLRDLYQRIDHEELEKIGVNDKEVLTEHAIYDLHEYSMLQRFRQNRDFKQVDKFVTGVSGNQTKQSQKKGNSTAFNSAQNKENKWWLSGNTQGMSEQEKKQKVEKTRYLKALKALVKEKGEKLSGEEIPNLCSCGALGENLQSLKKAGGKSEGFVHMCASNCQFYKNEKDYERALRDILHSISLFK